MDQSILFWINKGTLLISPIFFGLALSPTGDSTPFLFLFCSASHVDVLLDCFPPPIPSGFFILGNGAIASHTLINSPPSPLPPSRRFGPFYVRPNVIATVYSWS